MIHIHLLSGSFFTILKMSHSEEPDNTAKAFSVITSNLFSHRCMYAVADLEGAGVRPTQHASLQFYSNYLRYMYLFEDMPRCYSLLNSRLLWDIVMGVDSVTSRVILTPFLK